MSIENSFHHCGVKTANKWFRIVYSILAHTTLLYCQYCHGYRCFFFCCVFLFCFLLFWGFLNRTLEFLTDHFLFVGVLQTQRRVTFHLPDGSQESCSDSGLGDPEPSSTASTTQPLPLSFPQEEYYEQTSPNSRTEGDGNSDPESSEY